MASYGLLGAISGLGAGGMLVGDQMFKQYAEMERQDYLLQKQHDFKIAEEERAIKRDQDKNDAFLAEMGRMKTEKMGEDVSRLDEAKRIYESSELSDEDKAAGIGATQTAREQLNADDYRLSREEIGKAGLISGVIKGKDFYDSTGREMTTTDKLTNALLLKSLDTGSRERNVDRQEEGKDRRQDSRQAWGSEEGDKNRKLARDRMDKNADAFGRGTKEEREWKEIAKRDEAMFAVKDMLGEKVEDLGGKQLYDAMMAIERRAGRSPQEASELATAAIERTRKSFFDVETGRLEDMTGYKSRVSELTKKLRSQYGVGSR